MIFIICDDRALTISLKKKNVELVSGYVWDPQSNLIEVQDNIDDNLSQRVWVYSNIKKTKVDYISIDSSQNKAIETVFINVKDKPTSVELKSRL